MEKENPPNKSSFIKKFWNFLNEDSWASWVVSLILLIIIIKFLVFPGLSLATGSKLPLVVVESCSMYHPESFEDWWFRNSAWYTNRNITKTIFESFPMKNGFTKGDIIIVWGYSDYKKGDIIIFKPTSGPAGQNPIIHRIVSTSPIGTKGDHNSAQLQAVNNGQGLDETNILRENIIGKAVFKIPLLGWVKLIFFEFARPPEQRGFCS
jgi:signal peptidase I